MNLVTSLRQMQKAPRGTKQTVGTTQVDGWLRFYEHSRDLIARLQERGYDLWIVTASPNPVVAAIAHMVGIASDHVIGIRQLQDEQGRLTYDFQGCGPVSDRANSMITNVDGKRCWINKEIYGDTSERAIDPRDANDGPVFAFGDSGGDLSMLKSARYKLVRENPKAKALMEIANRNEDGSWLVNPFSSQPDNK